MDINQALEPAKDRLQEWGDTLIALAPNLVAGILILVCAWLLSKLGRRAVEKIALRAAARSAIARLLGTATAVGIMVAGLFVALGVLQLDKTVTSLLAGAGVIGIALGFAAQSMAANILSGTVISLRKPYKEGDVIESAEHFGTVEVIDLRVTEILTPEGQTVLLPNKEVLEQPLVNYSRLGLRRIDLSVGVSYSDDLDSAAAIAREAVSGISSRLEEREVELFYTEFGSSSIDFTVRFWIPFERQSDYLSARSEAIVRIKKAFDAHDITIPFPIRTLDFGIEGAQTPDAVITALPALGSPTPHHHTTERKAS